MIRAVGVAKEERLDFLLVLDEGAGWARPELTCQMAYAAEEPRFASADEVSLLDVKVDA